MKKKITSTLLALSFISCLFPLSVAHAATKTVTDTWWGLIKVEAGGVWATYSISVSGSSIAYYNSNSTLRRYELTTKRMGGVIEDGNAGIYPFKQAIGAARNYWYQNGTLKETWTYATDTSAGISDPNDLSYSYNNTTTKYLPWSNTHKLTGELTWVGNGTLPPAKTLTFTTNIDFN